MQIIYPPKGPAKEYARLALNIYKGCTHGCIYCFAPAASHRKAVDYFSEPLPKRNVIARVRADAHELSRMKKPPEILLSFIGDVYQPAELHYGITRAVIEILMEYGLSFTILTKGGCRAKRDFDLLRDYPKCRFGTSLAFFSQRYADRFEPCAAPISDRIDTIAVAKSMGIRTWVSLEPVVMIDQALQLVNLLHDLVDYWAVGKINHDKELEGRVNWCAFLNEVEYTLNKVNAKYFIKSSLERFRGGQ